MMNMFGILHLNVLWFKNTTTTSKFTNTPTRCDSTLQDGHIVKSIFIALQIERSRDIRKIICIGIGNNGIHLLKANHFPCTVREKIYAKRLMWRNPLSKFCRFFLNQSIYVDLNVSPLKKHLVIQITEAFSKTLPFRSFVWSANVFHKVRISHYQLKWGFKSNCAKESSYVLRAPLCGIN